MKVRLIILGFSLLAWQFTSGQDCPTVNLTFTSQMQVDAFIEMYPNCTEISGQLGISGADITNLNGLNNIKIVHGPFFVSNANSLQDFEGLENLEEINDWIRIQDNASFQSFKGLDNLKIIRGDYMYLSNLGGMETLDGFPALDTILGNIQIFLNPVLNRIEAFPNLRSAGNRIMVYLNPVLKEILGFDSLTEVTDLRIDDNDELESIHAFDRPFEIKEWIVIRDNPNLVECSIESICNQLDNSEVKKSFGGNAPGCSSLNDVTAGCTTTSVSDTPPPSFKIVPNPAYDEIFLESEKLRLDWPDTTLVYGMDGRTYKVASSNGYLQVSTLPAGTYICQTFIDGELLQITFVIH